MKVELFHIVFHHFRWRWPFYNITSVCERTFVSSFRWLCVVCFFHLHWLLLFSMFSLHPHRSQVTCVARSNHIYIWCVFNWWITLRFLQHTHRCVKRLLFNGWTYLHLELIIEALLQSTSHMLRILRHCHSNLNTNRNRNIKSKQISKTLWDFVSVLSFHSCRHLLYMLVLLNIT